MVPPSPPVVGDLSVSRGLALEIDELGDGVLRQGGSR